MEDLVQNERYSRMWKWSLDISDEYSRFKGTIFHYQLQTHSTTYPDQYLFMFSINLQAFYHEDINFICIWKDEKTPRISLSRKLGPVQPAMNTNMAYFVWLSKCLECLKTHVQLGSNPDYPI